MPGAGPDVLEKKMFSWLDQELNDDSLVIQPIDYSLFPLIYFKA
jgi:hypothetical protein